MYFVDTALRSCWIKHVKYLNTGIHFLEHRRKYKFLLSFLEETMKI